MIEIMNLQRTARQEFSVLLDRQNFGIRIINQDGRAFMDLALEGTPIFNGRICQDRVSMKQYRTRKFSGDFYWIDSNGRLDPYYPDFNTRFYLLWVSPDQQLGPELQIPSYML